MENKEGPVIDWKPLKLPEKEHGEFLKRNEELPEDFKEALIDLKEDLPQGFKDQAEEAAYFFWSLDTGRKLIDKGGQSMDEDVRRVADQISTSGFVLNTYVRAEYAFFGNKIDPKKALPRWVTERAEANKPVQLTEEEKDVATSFHTKYAEENGVYHAPHYLYEEGVIKPESRTNTFKLYIENKALKNTEGIKSSLETLKEKGIHPNQSKLHEGDRLVLYWNTPPEEELTNQITEVFEESGVETRGPAQDTRGVKVESDGNLNYEVIRSNDQSLGEGGSNPFRWKGEEYDRKEFFKQYIRLTFYGAKNPTNPYLVSFVPVEVPTEFGREKREEVKNQVEEESGLPVYITETPFMTAL